MIWRLYVYACVLSIMAQERWRGVDEDGEGGEFKFI